MTKRIPIVIALLFAAVMIISVVAHCAAPKQHEEAPTVENTEPVTTTAAVFRLEDYPQFTDIDELEAYVNEKTAPYTLTQLDENTLKCEYAYDTSTHTSAHIVGDFIGICELEGFDGKCDIYKAAGKRCDCVLFDPTGQVR